MRDLQKLPWLKLFEALKYVIQETGETAQVSKDALASAFRVGEIPSRASCTTNGWCNSDVQRPQEREAWIGATIDWEANAFSTPQDKPFEYKSHNYSDVEIEREALKCWLHVGSDLGSAHFSETPQHEKTDDKPKQIRCSAAEAERWYQERVAGWPSGANPPSREDDEREARDKGISRDKVRELRKKHSPASWSNRGRRKKLA